MPTNVDVPALGESVREAVLIKWHKQDGDSVAAAEPIAELETDKANVDVPSPAAGVLRRVKEEGETVAIGETIARIDEGAAPQKPSGTPGQSAAPPRIDKPEKREEPKPAQPKPEESKPTPKPEDLRPSVRRIASENQLDLSKTTGS